MKKWISQLLSRFNQPTPPEPVQPQLSNTYVNNSGIYLYISGLEFKVDGFYYPTYLVQPGESPILIPDENADIIFWQEQIGCDDEPYCEV